MRRTVRLATSFVKVLRDDKLLVFAAAAAQNDDIVADGDDFCPGDAVAQAQPRMELAAKADVCLEGAAEAHDGFGQKGFARAHRGGAINGRSGGELRAGNRRRASRRASAGLSNAGA